MAYVSQRLKAELAPKIKEICKQYGIKASLAVSTSKSSLVLNISQGNIDFIQNYNEVNADRCQSWHQFVPVVGSVNINPYWFHAQFSGDALDFLSNVFEAMNIGNHDNSDIMSDYFDVGWYVDINIGKWNKPYIFNASA